MSVRSVIAIIDDDEAVRDATESLVRSLGFGTNTFASAEEFLEWPEQNSAVCLITDVQMSGMSGVELQSHLRAAGRTLPMIFMTAFPDERVRRQANAGGATGFLSKPFDGVDLVACIDRALGQ